MTDGEKNLQETATNLLLWQSQISQQIIHNTTRIDKLVLDALSLDTRLMAMEKIPKQRFDLIKSLIPILAILFTITLGALGLEVTTLFFVLQHIAGGH